MKWKSLLLAISFATVGSTAFSSDAATKKIEGFKTPESVLVFKDGRLFVSEINEFGKDGDGQISEITRDGKVEVFASGLDDPKGMALIGKDIYVADKTRILKITPDGKWSVFTNSEAFPVKPLFLNDLASDNEGNLYVSETGNLDKGNGGAIYRINRDGKVTLTLNASDDPRVLGPNGIVVNDDRKSLLYIDFFSGSLYSVDLNTKVLTEQAKGFGGGDGLVRTKEGVIYVSDWKNGKIFEIQHGKTTLIKTGFKASADIALSLDERSLLVPDMKAGELVWLPLKK
jgi:sugar lactone lactonase YvrE